MKKKMLVIIIGVVIAIVGVVTFINLNKEPIKVENQTIYIEDKISITYPLGYSYEAIFNDAITISDISNQEIRVIRNYPFKENIELIFKNRSNDYKITLISYNNVKEIVEANMIDRNYEKVNTPIINESYYLQIRYTCDSSNFRELDNKAMINDVLDYLAKEYQIDGSNYLDNNNQEEYRELLIPFTYSKEIDNKMILMIASKIVEIPIYKKGEIYDLLLSDEVIYL